ncbi:MAG: ABC transporter permease, partial [Gemmiger sp.]|nr:ABC transporter permease [Gemmiger sp.]
KFFTPWRWNYALLSGGLLTGCALLATWSACRATLHETPAEMMRPRAPKAGKRIFLEYIGPLWRHLAFSQKVTCRNLLRYKKRFWMTVLGVSGCTALLVTGFGISDSLNGIVTKQYSNVSHYDLMTAVKNTEDTESGPVYQILFEGEGLADGVESLVTATEKIEQPLPDGSKAEVYLMVPKDTATFANFLDLHERESRKATPLGETGIVVTEKLADELNVKAGDTLALKNSDGVEGSFAVTGVCENYLSNYIYLAPGEYEQAFGEAPGWNAILTQLPDAGTAAQNELSARLLDLDAVASVSFTTDMIKTVLNMLNSINAVVVMIVVCAAGLALIVLYNLTNINIAERVKEIATIKVLGFYDKEVNAYVMRENVALSVIGAGVGLVLGIWLHKFVIMTVEVDAVMFGRNIEPMSFVYALVLTMLFSGIVNLIMARKLKKISMVESMKAPE